MTQIVEPKPIYRTLTEEDVRKALDDPDETNPVAIEIARLVIEVVMSFMVFLLYVPWPRPSRHSCRPTAQHR